MDPTIHRHRRRTWALVGWGIVAAVAALATGPTTAPTTAWAHPSKAPSTLAVAARGDDVVLEWAAAADDLAVLAGALGLVGAPPPLVADRHGDTVSGPGSDEGPLAVVASSPVLDDYVHQHVRVRAGGDPCPLAVDSSRFPTTIAVVASCGGSDLVTVEATLLQDLDPASRTVATSSTGDRVVLTRARPAGALWVGGAVATRSATTVAGPTQPSRRWVQGWWLAVAAVAGPAVAGGLRSSRRRRTSVA